MKWSIPLLVAAVPLVVLLARREPTSGADAPPPPPTWKILAWNDLGMHCMDGDYSIFSILPPYNTLQAQVVGPGGLLVGPADGVTLSYEAVTDPGGSINRTSAGKTDFWQFADVLYGGSTTVDTGLAGHDMPGLANVPQPMAWDGVDEVFTAEGIPIAPYDDAGRKRYYPMMRVVARDGSGAFLASTDVVLPVSDEMDCRACHASGASAAAAPASGWVFDPNPERDFRLNVLKRHDDRVGADAAYAAALAAKGYLPAGLHATAQAGTPILCASCHRSNALPGTGLAGVSSLTSAIHAGHADAVEPGATMNLDASQNRTACYSCHPGSETRCLRGAMGSAVADDGSLAMQCQSCHGSMSDVGHPAREGWLEEPSCQNCHAGTATSNPGQIRYVSAFDASGQLRQPTNDTFATNPDVPAAGFDLYRFSSGHGGLRCEACHGSTHAIYPASHGNDNVQAQALQGHVGTIADCTVCHSSTLDTVSGGPHGMHPISQLWVGDRHGDWVESHGVADCRVCHGSDDRGTVLSVAQGDRTFDIDGTPVSFERGARIGCWSCHSGPGSADDNPNHAPVLADVLLSVGEVAASAPVVASDQDGDPLELRIVRQPAHGAAALVNGLLTYYPEAGFAGTDTFRIAAWDGDVDTLATVTVTRGANRSFVGDGYPGSGGQIPDLLASAPPKLDHTFDLLVENTAGVTTFVGIIAGLEPLSIPSSWGGSFAVPPIDPAILVMPPEGLVIPIGLPDTPALTGFNVVLQSVQLDAGATFGYAFSRGLRLTFGP